MNTNIRIEKIDKVDSQFELAVMATTGRDRLSCTESELKGMKADLEGDKGSALNADNLSIISAALA